MEPSRCPREISRQIGIEVQQPAFFNTRTEGISALSGTRTHKNGAKLRGRIGAEQRQEKSRAIGLLIEPGPASACLGTDTDDGSPRQRVSRIERFESGDRSALSRPKCFRAKLGVHQRDWLFCVGSSMLKSRPSRTFKPRVDEIIVRNRFGSYRAADRGRSHHFGHPSSDAPGRRRSCESGLLDGGRIKLGVIACALHRRDWKNSRRVSGFG